MSHLFPSTIKSLFFSILSPSINYSLLLIAVIISPNVFYIFILSILTFPWVCSKVYWFCLMVLEACLSSTAVMIVPSF